MLDKINISFRNQNFIIYIVLAVVILAVFWQVSQYDFVYDDAVYITLNSHIKSGITMEELGWAFSTKYFGLWNPLIWLSFMMDYQFFGLKAGGYHLVNLILHIFSTLMLFWLFKRMTGAVWKSAFIAAFFALHPLHVESVAWIAERKDTLSAFFWILTLCFYVYYTEKPILKRYLLVLCSFVLALLSKPMVVTLPVIMVLLDYWPLSRFHSGSELNKENRVFWQLREKTPFFILSIMVVIITLYFPETTDNIETPYLQKFSLVSRLANAPVAFVTYLAKTFWPRDMAMFYPFIEHLPLWQVAGASLFIFAVTVFVIAKAKRLPYLFTGWLWFAITIMPVIGIIQISQTAPYAMADRYHYLPSVGIAMMLAWGITSLIKNENIRRNILLPATIVLLIILSFMSWRQCGYWKNEIELYTHSLRVTGDHYLTYYNRGKAYTDRNQYELAIADFDETIRLKPDYANAYNNRGVIYGINNQLDRAIEEFNKAIGYRPDHAHAYSNRAFAYLSQGNLAAGCNDARKACELGNCKTLQFAGSKGFCQ